MLASLDDGGCFDRILREVEEAANGDEALKLQLLANKVFHDLVKIHLEASLLLSLSEGAYVRKENGAKEIDNFFGLAVPRGKRSATRNFKLPGLPAALCLPQFRAKKNLKRRLHDGIQNAAEGEQIIKKPKPQKKFSVPDPHADMPQAFKNYVQGMNGDNIMLVIQKRLTDCDARKHHNRLTIPKNMVRGQFLTTEEKTTLDAKKGIQISLVQPSLEDTRLTLKKWEMGNTFCYVLIDRWYEDVVKNQRNGLEKGVIIQLWSFRRNSELCFALVKINDVEY